MHILSVSGHFLPLVTSTVTSIDSFYGVQGKGNVIKSSINCSFQNCQIVVVP